MTCVDRIRTGLSRASVAIACCTLTAQGQGTDKAIGEISYRIALVPLVDRTSLDVSVRFTTADGGAVTVGLPTDCFGLPDLHRFVPLFEGEAGTAVRPGTNASQRVAVPAPDKTVSIRYVLAFDPAVMEGFAYAPSVGAGYFHVAGCQWLLHVGDDAEQRRVRVEFASTPQGWRLYSTIADSASRFEVRDSYEALSESFIGAGRRWHTFSAGGRPVSVFVHADLDISAGEVFSAVERIVSTERRWFADSTQPFYSIVVNARRGTIAGYAPNNGFVCFVKHDITRTELNVLLAHQSFHNWLPNQILIQQDKRYSWLRFDWFSEGVADYLARRILLETGLLSRPQFVDLLNKDIVDVADNPHQRETYEALAAAAQAGKYDVAYRKLSHYRGALIALNWDAQLRRAGGNRNVGEFVRQLWALASRTNGQLSEPALVDAARSYGIDIPADLERYIMRGEGIPVAPEAIGSDFLLRTVDAPSFDPGYSVDETSRTKTVTGVRADGPAFRAGLRDGQALVSVANWNRFGNEWNSEKPLRVVVRVGGKDRPIEFYPRGAVMKVKLFRPR